MQLISARVLESNNAGSYGYFLVTLILFPSMPEKSYCGHQSLCLCRRHLSWASMRQQPSQLVKWPRHFQASLSAAIHNWVPHVAYPKKQRSSHLCYSKISQVLHTVELWILCYKQFFLKQIIMLEIVSTVQYSLGKCSSKSHYASPDILNLSAITYF